MMQGHFLGPVSSYDAIIPGSSIPAWFIHQSMGSSVKIELPYNWCNIKFIGLAACFVVDNREEFSGNVFQ